MLYILVFLDVASLTRNDDDDALRLQDDSGLYVASHGASGYDGRACPEVAPREAVVALAVRTAQWRWWYQSRQWWRWRYGNGEMCLHVLNPPRP